MTHATSVTVRLTEYRKRSLESLAKEKGLTLADLLRYACAASFALFENKPPKEAEAMCLRQKSEELLEQMDFERAVAEGVAEVEAAEAVMQ